MSLCNHSRNAEYHCLGKDLARKRKGKYFLLSATTPALLMAKWSGLLLALFPLGPLAPACSPPAAALASLLPKSWTPFRLSHPPSGSGSLSSWEASQHASPACSPHRRPGLGSPPATRGGCRGQLVPHGCGSAGGGPGAGKPRLWLALPGDAPCQQPGVPVAWGRLSSV